MATVGRGAEQYTVRFPDGLRDRIKVAADENNRSMNAEIVATLEEKYPAPKPKTNAEKLLVIRDMLDAAWSNKDLTYEAKISHLSAASQVLDLLTLEMSENEVEAVLGDWELLAYVSALLMPKTKGSKDRQGELELQLRHEGKPSGFSKLIGRSNT